MSSANHTQFELLVDLPDEAATLALGAALARILRPGLVIHLRGDLGMGKTTLTRGLLRALGHTGAVKSPTYTLVELYVISGYSVYHFDFYRFNSPEEWYDGGLEEHFDGQSICIIEWPEKSGGLSPAPDIDIELIAHGDARRVSLKGSSEAGTSCLSALPMSSPHTTR